MFFFNPTKCLYYQHSIEPYGKNGTCLSCRLERKRIRIRMLKRKNLPGSKIWDLQALSGKAADNQGPSKETRNEHGKELPVLPFCKPPEEIPEGSRHRHRSRKSPELADPYSARKGIDRADVFLRIERH